jgi:hypothetical protein
MNKEYEMIICNKKVFEFYNNNSFLNFEQINLLCIDLFENVLQDATTSINKSISSQILSECIENKNKMNELNNSLNTNMQLINSNLSKITSDIIIKLLDIKKDYVEEIKTIINLNSTNSNEKLREIIEKSNNIFINDITNKIDKNSISLISDITNKIDKNNISLISDITNKTDKNNNSLISDISTKIDDKIYILLNQMNSESLNRISSLIESSNNHIIDKTNILINQIIPENNKTNKQLQEDINKFYFSITEETKRIMSDNKLNNQTIFDFIKTYNERKDNELFDKEKLNTILIEMTTILNHNKTQQIENFISNFDNKYNSLMQTIQQPILQVLSMNDERINKNINKQQETQEKMLFNLDEFLNKYKNNSSLKGKFSENHLNKIIVQMFPTAEIIDTSKQSHSGDILVKREDKDNILLENKDYAENVSTDEVNKFISDCEKQKMHGIILSQNTGITSKKNYHIDIIKSNKILVYVHNVDYSQHKIQTAIDIIDTLSQILNKLENNDNNSDEEENTISKEILDDIYNEFNKFITHKETIINMIKDSNKKIIDEIKSIYIPSLEKYLNTKFGSDKITYTCDVCNLFVANNKRALSSHKRSKECKSKIIIENNIPLTNIEIIIPTSEIIQSINLLQPKKQKNKL